MTKTVVLTGGASGVGAATTARLVALGCDVHVLDVQPVSPGPHVHSRRCDLGDRSAIESAVGFLPEHVDALVNVAGVAGPTPADWVLRVNFLGLRHLVQLLLPRISSGGSVVSVSSVAGLGWQKRREVVDEVLARDRFDDALAWAVANDHRWAKDPYTFSKQCVTAYTYRAAGLALDRGVRVNCVSPGAVDTQLTPAFRAQVGEEQSDWIAAQIGRNAQPDDIAQALVWLAVGECRWVNGVDLVVDGGFQAGASGGWIDMTRSPAAIARAARPKV